MNSTLKVSTILATLHEDYVKQSADLETATKNAEQVTKDNEELRKANLKLFLQIGDKPNEEDKKKPADTTPKYEDLFDEKGNLK